MRGDPGERRRFLDDLLVARYPRYAGGAGRLRPGAAAALGAAQDRARRRRPAHPRRLGRPPRPARRGAAGRAAGAGRRRSPPPAVEAFAEVAPTSDPIALRLPVEPGRATLPTPTPPSWSALLLDALGRVRRQEVERGVCLVGPHRDDLELRLGRGAGQGLREPRRVLGARAGAAAGVLPAAARRRRRAGTGPRRRVRRARHPAPRALADVAAARRAGAGDRRGGRGRAGRARRRAVRGERRSTVDAGSRKMTHVRAPTPVIAAALGTKLWILWITRQPVVTDEENDRPSTAGEPLVAPDRDPRCPQPWG